MRLNSPTHQARTRALRQLLEHNRLGFLRSYSAGGGFVDQRGAPAEAKRVCSGLTRFLKSVTPAVLKRLVNKYTDQGAALGIRRSATFDQATRTTPSSMRRGVSVHQDLHHYYVCTSQRCVCSDNDMPLQTRSAYERRVAEQMVLAARTFIVRNSIEALACEQVVVASSPVNVGTRFDFLGKITSSSSSSSSADNDNAEDECWALVSWKTGGKYVYDDVSPERAAAEAPRGRKLHAKKEARRVRTMAIKEQTKHVAQVLAEAALLRREHGIVVERAYIVYLLSSDEPSQAGLPMYRVVQVMASALEQCERFWDEVVHKSAATKW